MFTLGNVTDCSINNSLAIRENVSVCEKERGFTLIEIEEMHLGVIVNRTFFGFTKTFAVS